MRATLNCSGTALNSDDSTLHWTTADPDFDWDAAVARLGGHPLQSRLWGDSRAAADGMEQLLLQASDSKGVPALARVETRRIPLLGKLAWVPRGPVAAAGSDVLPSLCSHLREDGYMLCACTPWQQATAGPLDANAQRTMWIDLSVGIESLLKQLDSQWRYGARRAVREGIIISQSTDDGDIAWFFALCSQISQTKGFRLPGNLGLLQQLLARSVPDAPVQARLFIARHGALPVAGAFIMRAGERVHYLWGGVDRAHNKLRAGEAVQWAVIEWAVAQGCTLYDLEGIDRKRNPGTYEFKKKMGGSEVVLASQKLLSLDWRGSLVKQALYWRNKVAG